MNGFAEGDPQLTNANKKGVIPIQSEVHGYCYYDANENGNLYSFDGELLGSPTDKEMDWIALNYKEKREIK